MKKLLLLSLALFSIQSFNNLSASEVGFSKKFNGKYILVEEKLAERTVMNCQQEVNLQVEDGKLVINNIQVVEFSNGCTGDDDSNNCNVSSPLSYKSYYNYRDIYEGDTGITKGKVITDTIRIELKGFKKDTFQMYERHGKKSLFQKSRPFDYKCTYKRI